MSQARCNGRCEIAPTAATEAEEAAEICLGTSLVGVSKERFCAYAETFISASDFGRTLFDAEGRPVGERYFPAEYRGDATFRFRRCPYDDDRNGAQMNVSALGNVLKQRPAVHAVIRELRRYLPEAESGDRMTWLGLWLIGRVATAIPAYLARRSADPATCVPPVASAVFKPSVGLYMVAERSFIHGVDADESPTPDTVVKVLHETRALFSEDAVCSGPPWYLRSIVEAALGVPADDRSPGAAGASGLPLAGAAAYGMAVARLEYAKFRYFLELEERIRLLSAAGVLRGGRHRPVAELRGVPVTAAELGRLCRRIRPIAARLDLTLPEHPAAGSDVGPGTDRPYGDRRAAAALTTEVAHDQRWAAALSALQGEALTALGGQRCAPEPLTAAELPNMAGYLAMDWNYHAVRRRYDLPARIAAAARPES